MQQQFDNVLRFIQTVRFPDRQTEIEVFALKWQAIYGDYQNGINKLDIKREQIDENNMIPYIEAWRKKQSISQNEAKKDLILLLDKKYPNWSILLSSSDFRKENKRFKRSEFQKEGIVYSYSKLKGKWKDRERQSIQLYLSLLSSSHMKFRIGFEDSQKALEWQDFLERVQESKSLSDNSKPSSKDVQRQFRSKSPNNYISSSHQQQRDLKGIHNQRNLSPLINDQQYERLNPLAKTTYKKNENTFTTKEAILEESKSDQEFDEKFIEIQSKDNQSKKDQITAQQEANKLQQQVVTQSQQMAFKINTNNNELSFGNENKFQFNQSNQSLGLEQSLGNNAFGLGLNAYQSSDGEGGYGGLISDALKKQSSKRTHEKILTPLEEERLSDEEDQQQQQTQNQFFNPFKQRLEPIASNNAFNEIVDRRSSTVKSNNQQLIEPKKEAGQNQQIQKKGSIKRKNSRSNSYDLTQKRVVEQIINNKAPQSLIDDQSIRNSMNSTETQPYSRLQHEIKDNFDKTISGFLLKPKNLLIENVPQQLEEVVKLIINKQSKNLMKIKEDRDTLIYNKHNLRVYLSDDKQSLEGLIILNQFNLKQAQDSDTLIFKSFYLIDTSLTVLKKLFEEPERMKLWDTNVQSTQLVNYLPSLNSKIFQKVMKPNEEYKACWQQLLIQYSSEINKETYYTIEQSIEYHANFKDQNNYIYTYVPLNIIIAKEKEPNKTEISQYLCVNLRNIQSRGFLIDWFFGKDKERYNMYLKLMKKMYEGLKNYSIVIQSQLQSIKKERIKSKSQVDLNEIIGQQSDNSNGNNQYQESQSILNKIMQTNQVQIHYNKDINFSQEQQEQSTIPFSQSQSMVNPFQQQTIQNRTPLNMHVQQHHEQQKPHYEDRKVNLDLDDVRFNERIQLKNSQRRKSSDRLNPGIRQNQIEEQKTKSNFDFRNKNHQTRQTNVNQARFQQNHSPMQHSRREEEKVMDHYKKSGISQRNQQVHEKYNREPSPIFQKKVEKIKKKRELQELQNINKMYPLTQKNSAQYLLPSPKEYQRSIEDLLDESREKQSKQNMNYDLYERRSFGSQKIGRKSRSRSISSHKKYNISYQGSETSEDSQYDFDIEHDNLNFSKGETNQFFEQNDFKVDHRYGLIYTNEELLKKQRGVLGHLMKQMGMNFLQGKSIINISLPIKIFDAKSFLEKIATFNKFSPIFFEKAAEIPQNNQIQALQRFKLVVANAVAMRHLGIQMKKPFNPILGETYQARCGKYKIGLEQISHHPPTCIYQMWSDKYKKFQVYGTMEYRAETGPNTVIGYGVGSYIVQFEENHKIEITAPKNEISGLMYGERVLQIFDTMHVKDKKNNLYAEVVFNPDKKSGLKALFSGKSGGSSSNDPKKRIDYFEGCISKIDNIDYKRNRGRLVEGSDYICQVNGFWTEETFIDGVRFWHYNDSRGYEIRPVKNPLQSDCRFREDLIYLREGDEDQAQQWKETLEDLQRNDKKLREAAAKRRKRYK